MTSIIFTPLFSHRTETTETTQTDTWAEDVARHGGATERGAEVLGGQSDSQVDELK